MTSSSNWKDMLRAQYKDLESLEAMDAQLNVDQESITANIDKILKRKSPSYRTSSRQRSVSEARRNDEAEEPMPAPVPMRYESSHSNMKAQSMYQADDDEEVNTIPPKSPDMRARATSVTGPIEPELPRAPETQVRYFKAKVKVLEKQVEDFSEIRKQLNDQVSDLQKQLKAEKDETKLLKKRVQLLETENRRNGRKVESVVATASTETNEQLLQELNQMKKDLQAAERIVKQQETSEKSKDTQLKRAAETISRLKAQISELQVSGQQNGAPVDRALFDACEQKVKTLEKQKSELVTAFKKQMRLIDILKRQKAHLEAARLLSFTEEEFLKVLDWAT